MKLWFCVLWVVCGATEQVSVGLTGQTQQVNAEQANAQQLTKNTQDNDHHQLLAEIRAVHELVLQTNQKLESLAGTLASLQARVNAQPQNSKQPHRETQHTHNQQQQQQQQQRQQQQQQEQHYQEQAFEHQLPEGVSSSVGHVPVSPVAPLTHLGSVKVPHTTTAVANLAVKSFRYLFVGDSGGWVHVFATPAKHIISFQPRGEISAPIAAIVPFTTANDLGLLGVAYQDGVVNIRSIVDADKGTPQFHERTETTVNVGNGFVRTMTAVKRPKRLILLDSDSLLTHLTLGGTIDHVTTSPFAVNHMVRQGVVLGLATVNGPVVFDHASNVVVECRGQEPYNATAIGFDPSDVSSFYTFSPQSNSLLAYRMSLRDSTIHCDYTHSVSLHEAGIRELDHVNDIIVRRDHVILCDKLGVVMVNHTVGSGVGHVMSVPHSFSDPQVAMAAYPFLLVGGGGEDNQGHVDVYVLTLPRVESGWLTSLLTSPWIALGFSALLLHQLYSLCQTRNRRKQQRQSQTNEDTPTATASNPNLRSQQQRPVHSMAARTTQLEDEIDTLKTRLNRVKKGVGFADEPRTAFVSRPRAPRSNFVDD